MTAVTRDRLWLRTAYLRALDARRSAERLVEAIAEVQAASKAPEEAWRVEGADRIVLETIEALELQLADVRALLLR